MRFNDSAARAFRIAGATVVVWQEDKRRVLCRLRKSDEREGREGREAREAIEQGDCEKVKPICRGAEWIQLAIGKSQRNAFT
jgi:hypothetical protein